MFLPRLIYNAEAWSSLTEANIHCLQKAQLHYLRRVLEIPKSTPTAALFLDLGILPIQYEIEKKQLLYMKCVLEKNASNRVQQTNYQMLEYQGENNWANHTTFLRRKYNLPLNDCNLLSMSKQQWKTFVTGRIKHHAIKHLTSQCETNRKTMHLKYSKLGQSTYFTALKPKYARISSKQEQECMTLKQILEKNMKAILCVLSIEGMPKALSTFSNARMDWYALSTDMMLLWSHSYILQIQGF